MISLKIGLYFEDQWLAFPCFLISLRRILKPNSSSVGFLTDRIKFLINRPSIEHYFAVKENHSDSRSFTRYFESRCDSLSENQFRKYTIICAATQGKLNRKLDGSGVYDRSKYPDGLDDLEWISAQYHWASYRVISSMDSPILLFDTTYSSNVVQKWCTAFISFLAFGALSIDVSHNPFYLGRIELKLQDLLKD